MFIKSNLSQFNLNKIKIAPIPYLNGYEFKNLSEKSRFRKKLFLMLKLQEMIKENANQKLEIIKKVF